MLAKIGNDWNGLKDFRTLICRHPFRITRRDRDPPARESSLVATSLLSAKLSLQTPHRKRWLPSLKPPCARHAAATQSLLPAATTRFLLVHFRTFQRIKYIAHHCSFKGCRRFQIPVARMNSSPGEARFKETSSENTRVVSKRNSLATSSIMSGVTLRNCLAKAVIRAFSHIVLIRRGKPRE